MDITSDTTRAVLCSICRSGAPEYVMKAGATTKEAADRIPESLFADSFNRRYPVDSKANTWLSAAYFAKTAGDEGYVPEVREFILGNIRKAADAYGNRKDVDEAVSRFSPRPQAEKRAEDDSSNYGWPERRKYPMFDAEGAKRASSYFADNAYKYPPETRHSIARRIFAKCAEYGVEPTRTVRTESGNGLNKVDYVVAASMDRARRIGELNPKMGMAVLKLAEAFSRVPGSRMHDAAVKFASYMEQVDMATGLHKSYGVRVESPADIFFGVSVKQAQAELDDTVVLGGDAFSVSRLAELPLEVFTGALGDDFGERVKSASGDIDVGKLHDELHSMPMPDKKALRKSIEEYSA